MTTKRHPPRLGRDGKSSDGLPHRVIECGSSRVDEGIEHAVGLLQQPTNPVVAIDAPRFRTPRVYFEIAGRWNDTTSTTPPATAARPSGSAHTRFGRWCQPMSS